MEVVITSDRYREGHFAEIRDGNYVWAELSFDVSEGAILVTIFEPPPGMDRYVFRLADVQDALERAKGRFMQIDHTHRESEEDIPL